MGTKFTMREKIPRFYDGLSRKLHPSLANGMLLVCSFVCSLAPPAGLLRPSKVARSEHSKFGVVNQASHFGANLATSLTARLTRIASRAARAAASERISLARCANFLVSPRAPSQVQLFNNCVIL